MTPGQQQESRTLGQQEMFVSSIKVYVRYVRKWRFHSKLNFAKFDRSLAEVRPKLYKQIPINN